MNRTSWARSPGSAQRNPTRRCFTHSLLRALIVYPLPVLTLCYLFSQEVLEIKFSYLKLSLTHSKTYFKLGNFGEQFKTELLLSVIHCLLYCLWKHTVTLPPQHSWGVSQVQLQGLIGSEFLFNYRPPEKREETSPRAINKHRHQTWGMQGVRSSLLVTTHSSNLLVQHNS